MCICDWSVSNSTCYRLFKDQTVFNQSPLCHQSVWTIIWSHKPSKPPNVTETQLATVYIYRHDSISMWVIVSDSSIYQSSASDCCEINSLSLIIKVSFMTVQQSVSVGTRSIDTAGDQCVNGNQCQIEQSVLILLVSLMIAHQSVIVGIWSTNTAGDRCVSMIISVTLNSLLLMNPLLLMIAHQFVIGIVWSISTAGDQCKSMIISMRYNSLLLIIPVPLMIAYQPVSVGIWLINIADVSVCVSD